MAEKKPIVKTKREVERKPAKKPLENINSFVYKLWTLVNDECTPSIQWSLDGEKVVIENPAKFTAKVLVASDKQLFKTKNISSFIRQLNMYGFRRVKENSGKIPLIFKHESFKQGRPDLLVDVKRKKSTPLKQPITSAALPLPTPKGSKPIIQQNYVPTIPGFSLYPSLPISQPYNPYFNNPTVGKNVSMPFVKPFVNHGPTFINMASHPIIFSKPWVPASTIEENNTIVQTPESKEFYNLEVPSEPLQNPWQHTPYYKTTTPLQDHKTPTPSNTMAQKAFMQFHGNYYIPQLGYRNYGDPTDSMSYQNLRHDALSANPYLPFSFPGPPFPKSVSLPSSPKTPEHFHKPVQVKTDESTIASPTTSTKASLESFGVFKSRVPKTEVNEEVIFALTADDEKE
ncbi:heat shock factor 5-like [Paramuricea clavata]|uniref:Heat shock factor 5-like n=1 Tax=Paramuricea clavata TaxID=317549 RepID=A0A6S7K103_PARCT|nr:heat shock factor 5-like [Paramuricea clavata]